ncbi:hypothetical protein IWQ61_003385 [Dispira simplex]|nr:hypothetical protein IWQ61_003385 [Dispira simplex]
MLVDRIPELVAHATGYHLGWYALLGIAVASCATYWVVYQLWFNPLARLPGPFINKIIPAQLLPPFRNGELFMQLQELHDLYGPMVRLGPNTISIIDYKTIQEVYHSYDYPKAMGWYQGFRVAGHGFFDTTDGNFHRQRKRIMQPAFTVRSLRAMEGSLLEFGVGNMFKYFHTRYQTQDGNKDDKSSLELNIYHTFTLTSLDMATKLSLGKSVNMLSMGSHPITTWFSSIKNLVVICNVLPFLRFVNIGFSKLRRDVQAFKDYANDCIAERESRIKAELAELAKTESDPLEALKQRGIPDILGNLLVAQDPETGAHLSREDLITETIVLLFGGGDTTASSMSMVLFQLFHHPNVLRQLQQDLRDAFPLATSGEAKQSSQLPLNLDTIKALDMSYENIRRRVPLLEAVIYESLRIFPTSPGNFWRAVPPGGRVLGGYFIPGGTEIGGASAAYHHGSEWADPWTFKPERFMGPEGEKRVHKTYYFSTGQRQCIGKALALMEMSIILSAILRCFSLEVADVSEMDKEWRHFVTLQPLDQKLQIRIRPQGEFEWRTD